MKRKWKRATAGPKISVVVARVDCARVVIRQGVRRRALTVRERERAKERNEEEKERRDRERRENREGKEGGVDTGRNRRSTAYQDAMCAARRRRWRPRPPPTGCYFAFLFVPSSPSERSKPLPTRGRSRGDHERNRISQASDRKRTRVCARQLRLRHLHSFLYRFVLVSLRSVSFRWFRSVPPRSTFAPRRSVPFRFVSFRFVSSRLVLLSFVPFRSVPFRLVSFRLVSFRSVPTDPVAPLQIFFVARCTR